MKTLLSFFAAAILVVSSTPSAEARVAVSVDFFYNNLDPYGDWQEVGDYGYCWRPRDVGGDWSPYSDGRWVYTDAGWTWDSEEPYGWAVYHYGRWANVERVGWVWIPGTEWGPGWVSWRRSPEYVGWAPLPPEARFLRAVGLSVWVDDRYDIGPGNYRFVEGRDFGAPRLNSVFIDRRRNTTIIYQTTNITNITYVNNVVHNGGMGYEEQSRLSSTPVKRYKLDRRQDFDGDPRNQKAEQLRSRVSGDSLSVQAPSFVEKSGQRPPRVAKKVDKAQINRGWKDAGTPAEIAVMKTKLKSNAASPAEPPKQAEPAKAPDKMIARQPEAKTGLGSAKEEKPSKKETAKEEKPSKKEAAKEEKPLKKEPRSSVPEKKPEANKPKQARSDDAKREQPRKSEQPSDKAKQADKVRKSEARQPDADEMPKAKEGRKPADKASEARPKKDNGKGKAADKDDKKPDEAPERKP